MNIMSGRPNGYWMLVRTYFAQNRIYTVTLYVDWTYTIRYRNGGYAQVMVKSMISRNDGTTQLILQNRSYEGGDVLDTYKCYNGDIEIDFLLYI